MNTSPPKIDLESYKNEISTLFQQQFTTDTIRPHLRERHSIDVVHYTARNFLKIPASTRT